jgi:hypothetical protein
LRIRVWIAHLPDFHSPGPARTSEPSGERPHYRAKIRMNTGDFGTAVGHAAHFLRHQAVDGLHLLEE